ncbi:hypothetical protein ACLOJK_016277 [Asimina triloba]
MSKCFSFTASRDWCYRATFSSAGLQPTTTDLGDGTNIHCWAPRVIKAHRPALLLIHGFGASAIWQWSDALRPLLSRYNVYVPDLIFFGDSYTSRPERSESFQAECMVKLMQSMGVRRLSLVGISYGGFVGYRIAADYPELVEKVVLCCAGVCLEAKDLDEGLFVVKDVNDAADLLMPQTPEKLRELVKLSFYKPQRSMPSCFLTDFIDVGLFLSIYLCAMMGMSLKTAQNLAFFVECRLILVLIESYGTESRRFQDMNEFKQSR